jgi:hypothetical protein
MKLSVVKNGILPIRRLFIGVLPRLLIGGTLAFSATAKLPMHSEFVNLVNGYHLLPVWLGTAYASALPWVELVVGVYLILGILVRPTAVIAALTGISFMIANVSSIIRGDTQCLHCFGQVIALSPSISLIIDILIVSIAVYLAIITRDKQALGLDWWFARGSVSKID